MSCLFLALCELLINVAITVNLLTMKCVYMTLMGSHIKNLQLRRYTMFPWSHLVPTTSGVVMGMISYQELGFQFGVCRINGQENGLDYR